MAFLKNALPDSTEGDDSTAGGGGTKRSGFKFDSAFGIG